MSLFRLASRPPSSIDCLLAVSNWESRISVCFRTAAVDAFRDWMVDWMSSSRSGRVASISIP